MSFNTDELKKKIIYRSTYRGNKEMDIFMGKFVKSIVGKLFIDDLNDLDILVNMNDEDINKIIKGKKEFNNKNILKHLKDFK